MREIKFRGKDENLEWKYGFLFQGVAEENKPYSVILRQERYEYNPMLPKDLPFAFGKDEVFPVYNDSIGQFTGLHDKNGKDIYEGDIVLQQGYNGKKTPMAVRFEHGSFIVGYHEGSSTKRKPMLLNYQCEVIGNIVDNPELINKED